MIIQHEQKRTPHYLIINLFTPNIVMKTNRLLIFFLLCMSLFSSCEKLEMPALETENNSSELCKVAIRTRSTTEDIQYPIRIYAFDSNGNCASQQTLESESSTLSLSLSAGNYHIVAVSGEKGYSFPSSPSPTSLVKMADENNCSSVPLQMGEADINVESGNQTVNIILSYKVSTLNLELKNIPSSVQRVSVLVSQQYNAVNLKGEYVEGMKTKVELQKSGTVWKSDNVYVFPGSNSQTVFSIAMTDENGTTTYGYTYPSPLSVARPYNFFGTFSSDMINLTGTITSEGWGAPVALNFTFGSGTTDSNPSKEEESGGTESVTNFPLPGTLWNGHLVAYVSLADGSGMVLNPLDYSYVQSAKVILLSLDEWTGVSSFFSENSSEANTLCSHYEENGLGEWSIPLSSEAKNLQELYNETSLEELNKTITSAGGKPIQSLNERGEYIRYLCEDASYTFAWKPSGGTSKAGTKTLYSLRLVKRITINKE